MFRNGFFIFRLIGVLLLIGLIIGGGFMAYRAGVSQGIAQAPAVATAISKAAGNGQTVPLPPMYGYGYGYPYWMWGPHFGFFPFGICGSILLLFLFLGLLRLFFFRPWHMGWAGHHGSWRGEDGRPWGGPPWMRHYSQGEEGEKKAETPEEKK